MTGDNALYQFVGAFVDELAAAGLKQACVCPGSRSTPLTLLLHRHPAIKIWIHLDERSAAFFALGMAKASREPVAIVATSGTATVNFAPAVVEAYYARVPLLVLTADRPPELRAVGALQTIDQVRLYGSHVKWFVEMLLPKASGEAIRYARTVACRAVAIARAEEAGPVHLNFPFREPLIPVGRKAPPGARNAMGYLETGSQRPYVMVTRAPQKPEATDLDNLAETLSATERGLLVCGPQDDPCFPSAVVRLAQELSFPLLADPLSQVRCGPQYDQGIITSYDAFLREEEIGKILAPEVILRFGATPISKPLSLYLQHHASCRQFLIETGEGWHDPALIASDVLSMQPRALCEGLWSALRKQPQTKTPKKLSWMASWEQLEKQTRITLQNYLHTVQEFCEPRVFSELAQLLPADAILFSGNSMPIRDLDTFFPGQKQRLRFLANRGVSGIDGVVSTALGASAVSPGPLVLVIGDLSFYHDMNGLFAAKRHHLQATIILLHNDGGGIFSFLPQAQEVEHFEELFGTPHGLDFRYAAEMYGLTYQRPESWETFRSAIQQALKRSGVTLIEVRTERRTNLEIHRTLWKAVTQSIRPYV